MCSTDDGLEWRCWPLFEHVGDNVGAISCYSQSTWPPIWPIQQFGFAESISASSADERDGSLFLLGQHVPNFRHTIAPYTILCCWHILCELGEQFDTIPHSFHAEKMLGVNVGNCFHIGVSRAAVPMGIWDHKSICP